MTYSTRRRALPIAALTALALALCLATAGSAAAAPAFKLWNYKGGAAKDPGAELLVKAEVSKKGTPLRVSVIRLREATAQCAVEPNSEKTVPTTLKNWLYEGPLLAVHPGKNVNAKQRLVFDLSVPSNATPAANEGEEVDIRGTFAPNHKSVSVSLALEDVVVKGSAVGSSRATVPCSYSGAFKLNLKR